MEKVVKGRGISRSRKFWLGLLRDTPGFLLVDSFDTIKELVDYAVCVQHKYLPYTNLSTSITRNVNYDKRFSLVWVDREQGLLVWVEYLDYEFK